MKVLVQMRSSGQAHAAAMAGAAAPVLTAAVETAVAGLTIDPSYPPVQVPGVKSVSGVPMLGLAQPLMAALP